MIWVVSRNDFGFLVCQFEMLIVVHFALIIVKIITHYKKSFILKSECPVTFSA